MSIARAIIKNPSILLMDEATASLDESSQAKVVEMIRGPKGTPVTLTVLRAHPADPSKRQETLTLVRDVIKLEDQAAKAKFYETPNSSSTHQ